MKIAADKIITSHFVPGLTPCLIISILLLKITAPSPGRRPLLMRQFPGQVSPPSHNTKSVPSRLQNQPRLELFRQVALARTFKPRQAAFWRSEVACSNSYPALPEPRQASPHAPFSFIESPISFTAGVTSGA